MLLLPLDRSIDWKKPPLVTVALIALCSYVFFVVYADRAAS